MQANTIKTIFGYFSYESGQLSHLPIAIDERIYANEYEIVKFLVLQWKSQALLYNTFYETLVQCSFHEICYSAFHKKQFIIFLFTNFQSKDD